MEYKDMKYLGMLLSRAHGRIERRKIAHHELDKKASEAKEIIKASKAAPARKKKLYSALEDLKKAMLDVIETEKSMQFFHKTKTEAERAIEHKIIALEEKLNVYLGHREKRLQRFEQLEKKIERKLQTGGSGQALEKKEHFIKPRNAIEVPLSVEEKHAETADRKKKQLLIESPKSVDKARLPAKAETAHQTRDGLKERLIYLKKRINLAAKHATPEELKDMKKKIKEIDNRLKKL